MSAISVRCSVSIATQARRLSVPSQRKPHSALPSKSRPAQLDLGTVGRVARRGGHKCAACLEGGSNNGATATADEHQFAIGGLRLSEDRLSLTDAAGRMIGS
jgi:hypothetical protein